MEESGLVFRPFINPWTLLAVAVVAIALSVIGYSRTTRTVSRRFKGVLMALRVAAIAVALACLLRPSIETARYELLKRPLLLLVDQSRSMSEINDTPTGLSRLDAVRQLLTDNEARIGSLREVYDVVILGFARGLLGGGRGDDAAAARHSAYGLALEQAFREVTSGQSDAVVILGDGSHNLGPPDPTDVAAALNELGVPVYTVGVGQGQASADLRDVKVVEVSAPKSAFLFTGFPVRPQILFRGCQGLPVKVRLEVSGQRPQEQTVTAAHSEEVVPLEFEVVPEKVGDHRLTVRAESIPDEILESNNSYVTYVKVVSSGVRVGFFDTVRPESKFIARGLDGAESLSVWRELVLLGQRLPDERTETDRYDVLILGDLAAAALLPSRLLELKRGIQEEGKGLVALLSQESGGREGWRNTALEDILPVKLEGQAAVAKGDRWFRVASGHADHPVLTLGTTPSATLKAWEEMPPLAGAVTGLKPKRGATTLAVDQDGEPLLVVHRSGRGRVACLMADTTFRWFFTERNTQNHHRRFWRQLVLWAAGRDDRPRDRLQIELSTTRPTLQDDLKMTVRLVGPDNKPVRDAELSLQVTDPRDEKTDVPYAFSRAEEAYVAAYVPLLGGDYMVVAEAKRGDEPLGRDRVHFHATKVDAELEDPVADLKLLRRIAAATEEVGGQYYYHTQAGELFDELAKRAKPLKLATRHRKDIWDAWPLFALFAACVVTEWALRKWKGLV